MTVIQDALFNFNIKSLWLVNGAKLKAVDYRMYDNMYCKTCTEVLQRYGVTNKFKGFSACWILSFFIMFHRIRLTRSHSFGMRFRQNKVPKI